MFHTHDKCSPRLRAATCQNCRASLLLQSAFKRYQPHAGFHLLTPLPKLSSCRAMATSHPFGFPPRRSSAAAEAERAWEKAAVQELIAQLIDSSLRGNALLLLSKKRESVDDLAPMLWNSFGVIAVLIQEIISIYPALSPPTVTLDASNRICNALALLQCVASHPTTRPYFLRADIPPYLFPFLNTKGKARPLEYLRLTSLGVLGALVKADDREVVAYLLKTELVPLCLETMENGSELSKTVATFIVQKIILDDEGLKHICSLADRFYAFTRVLTNMIVKPTEPPSARLLKHIIRCYLRLTDNPRACLGVKRCVPQLLRDEAFKTCLREDPVARQWFQQVMQNVNGFV